MKRFDHLDIIIPISLDLDWPTVDHVIEEILEQHEKYGFTRFALACPCGGWRSIGYPPTEFFVERAEMFAQVRDALKVHNIECGWWITTTLKIGVSTEFTTIVRGDGTKYPTANCPLDPAFRKRFAGDVAVFAKIAKPAFIITEDDFSVTAASGCYCDLHLAEFSRREGKEYTRAELISKLNSNDPENFDLVRRWRELAKDSLVGLAEEMRRAVDVDSPEIPIGYMEPCGSDIEANCTLAMCKALAGPNHTPFSRLFGIHYHGMRAEQIPQDLFHAIYQRQHIEGDFAFYHESDTFPHTRFFTAGKEMKTVMAAVYSAGFDGSTFQTQQLLDNANEETAYGEMFCCERARFNALHKAAKQCQLNGAELCFDPFWNHVGHAVGLPQWINSLTMFGLPWTTKESNIAFWDKAQAMYSDDAVVRKYLSKKLLFLDGAAAKILGERGYGEYLGVSVGKPVTSMPGNELLQWDLAAREIIREEFVEGKNGHNMPSAYMFAASNGTMLQTQVTDPACRIITDMYSYDRRYITPAMTCFQNSLGGTVVVMSITLENNHSQALFNYRRQRLIHALIRRYCDEIVYLPETPRVFTLMNDAVDPQAAGFKHLLTLSNLSPDMLEKVEIHLPATWQDTKRIEILRVTGEWETVGYAVTERGIVIDEPMSYLEPMYLRFH